MKKLLLGAVFLPFIASNVLAQSSDIPPYCADLGEECGDGSECIVVAVCAPRPEVIVVGERIGFSEIDEITSPTSLLNAQDINLRNQHYVSDLLRSVPGVSVNASGPANGLTQIRLRGSEASHVLVLIDGVEAANPTAGEFDFAGLRAADIVRIEVMRGEQSALYGSDAVGGVINIITNASGNGSFGNATQGNAGLEFGGDNSLEGHFVKGFQLGNSASVRLSGTAFNTEGYDISGLDGEKDGGTSRAFSVGLNTVKLGPVTMTAKGSYTRTQTDFDSDDNFDGRLENTNGETIVENISGRADARFAVAGFNNLITLSHSDTDTDTMAGFSSRSIGKRTNLNWAAKKKTGAHSITLLGEGERESYAIMPNFAFSPDAPKNTTYGIAGDYRYHKNALTLTASARQDFNDRFADAFTWRIGGGYAFQDIGGRLRASYGKGVKNPSLIELFGFFPESNFVGNPDLTPEKSLGYSIGYDQEISDFNFSIDYFRSDLENEIFTDFSSFPFLARNRTTDSKREGVELEARWGHRSDPITARASVTFLDATENGIKEIRRPEFLASGTVTWRATDNAAITLSADHTGSQLDTDFATFAAVKLDAFTLVGANASYQVNDAVTVSLRGENLLDETYQEVVGYASPGRAVYAGVSAGF